MASAESARAVPARPRDRIPAAGDLIGGKYRLEDPIAVGGMGTIWRAHNEALGTAVAIKLVRSDAMARGATDRLLTEARAAANVHHPAVVRVFDLGTAPTGEPFVVMELLSGETLRDRLDHGGSMAPADAIRMILPILAGIEAAHSHGIVHRDLKPDNIVLARHDGANVQPKIVDFGIAKITHASPRITSRGSVIGSPEYMAPEQAAGVDEVDARVDIWSAGVVLYEMIAGRPPWSAPNCPALLRSILDDDAPSLLGAHGVDASLWAVLEFALAKDRARRWKSAREFGSALACWLLANGYSDDIAGASLKACWPATQTSAAPVRRFVPPARSRNTTRRRARRGRRNRRATLAKWTLGALVGICSVILALAARQGGRPEVNVMHQALLVTEQPVESTAEIEPEITATDDAPPPDRASRASHPVRKSSSAIAAPPAISASANPASSSSPTPAGAPARQMDFGF